LELSPDLPHIRHFDVFEVNLRSGELCQPGSKIRLRDQSLQILAFLLEHPGEVVTREELQSQLWPDGVVVDFEHSINSAVKRLRKVLSDDAENPRYIETLPRHGYRFIAPVEAVASSSRSFRKRTRSAEPAEGPLRRRRTAAMLGVALVIIAMLFALNVAGLRDRVLSTVGPSRGTPLPKIVSIAVLPFENLSGNPEREYLADGMTEELITDLAEAPALRVISRTSVMQYRRTRKPLPEVARELHVDAVLEGAVLGAGDRVRITAQLIDAGTDRHLWAASYERDLRDRLSSQDAVARAIANEVRIKLTPQENPRLAGSRPSTPEAGNHGQ
jgi:TolB-like protein/DNA-binding winged helix-turn-helix (wHTH) protein